MGYRLLTLCCILAAGLRFSNTNAEDLWSASLAQMVERDSLKLEQELTAAQNVLAMGPVSARSRFLLYQLATAINSGSSAWLELEVVQEHEQEQEQELLVEQQMDSSWLPAMANEFQHIPLYESFAINFESWLMDSYGLNAADVYQNWPLTRSSIHVPQLCNAIGQCYEMAQIVAACCPF